MHYEQPVNQIEGTVINIGDRQTFNDSFYKQEIVIKTAEKYPQEIPVEFIKENCNIIRNISEGDHVTVHFTVRGRSWQKDASSSVRWFINLEGVDCEHHAQKTTTELFNSPEPLPAALEADEDDSLPF